MKKVMTRAWEIAKEAVVKFGGKAKEYFRQALVMAWAEFKGGNKVEEKIEKLKALGANRWEKAGHDRLYLNKAVLKLINLEIEYYKSGNIRRASVDGKGISNSEAYRIINCFDKAYVDVKDWTLKGYGRRANEFVLEGLEEAIANL